MLNHWNAHTLKRLFERTSNGLVVKYSRSSIIYTNQTFRFTLVGPLLTAPAGPLPRSPMRWIWRESCTPSRGRSTRDCSLVALALLDVCHKSRHKNHTNMAGNVISLFGDWSYHGNDNACPWQAYWTDSRLPILEQIYYLTLITNNPVIATGRLAARGIRRKRPYNTLKHLWLVYIP